MKRSFIIAATAFLTLASASAAHAQLPVKFGVAGGASVPLGDLGDVTDLGFNLAASVSFKPAMLPFGLRAEGAWDQFDFNNDADVTGHVRVLSLTGNGIVEVPSATPLKVYFIGGVGLYNLSESTNVGTGTFTTDGDNKFGFNLGGGIRLPLTGLDTYVEARYHKVTDSHVSYLPITFGVRF